VEQFAAQATIVQRRDFSVVSSSPFYFIPLTLRVDAWSSLVKPDPTLPDFLQRKLKLPRWVVMGNYSCSTFTNNNSNKQFVRA
jgi:hypothetical protein